MLLDSLGARLESGVAGGSRARVAGGGGLLAVVVVGGLLAPTLASLTRSEIEAKRIARDTGATEQPLQRPVRVGSKTFTEQYILAALVGDRLRTAGLPVQRVDSLGSTVGFDALTNNDVDVWIDYTGTIWANYMGRGDTQPGWHVLDAVTGWSGPWALRTPTPWR